MGQPRVVTMNHENQFDNGQTPNLNTVADAQQEIQRLSDENARLGKEIAELRFECDMYHRSVMTWAKERFASQPLPPIPQEAECQDIRDVLHELEQESTER